MRVKVGGGEGEGFSYEACAGGTIKNVQFFSSVFNGNFSSDAC